MFVNGVMTSVGVFYCVEHDGIRNEDENTCDFRPEQCDACKGSGDYDDDPLLDEHCPACWGTGEPSDCRCVDCLIPAYPSLGGTSGSPRNIDRSST